MIKKTHDVTAKLWVELTEERKVFVIRIYARIDGAATIIREYSRMTEADADRTFRRWKKLLVGDS